ncbi:MAG: hypothetical protein Q4P15_06760 [Propionibacteriaceae bacterium]|nr:hypothetical protein [Propionibacteriaceae bacterium]
MRRLTSLIRWPFDVALDLTHAALAQLAALRARGDSPPVFALGPSDCAPIPVVLLPGILESSTYLAPLGGFLASKGHPVHVVDTLGWNISTIDESVERCIAVLSEQDIHGAVFVAHSKGGLIGKALLLDPRLGDAAIALVAVATPFAGSTLGGPFQRLPLVQHTPLGLFFPTNQALTRLAEERDVNTRIASLAPEWDQMIPGGSHLDGATNVTLENRGHFRTIDDPRVWEQVHIHVHKMAELTGEIQR